MKILHIGKYFSPFSGGLENYMRDAMVALAKKNITSIALVHRHAISFRTRDENYTAGGHNFHIIRTGMWARVLFTPISPAFPWHLRRAIRQARPAILHLHLPNPSAFWALALPSARRIPWVVHWHSDVITAAQGGLMRLFYALYRPFEQALLKRARTIVATSPPYRDTSGPLEKWRSKCRVVPLGVDAGRFGEASQATASNIGAPSQGDQKGCAPDGANRSEGALPTTPLLRVLAVGRLTYYKGFQYLVKAAAKVPGVHVNLVGHGDQAENLERLVVSLGLQDRVNLDGHLSDDELARRMAGCDCLCLPSIERTEAFGMVLLEAMYFGKTTIVSDVKGSGMGWIVEDGITGIKVRPANVDALAKALKRLSEDRAALIRMGLSGKEKFDQKFEINHAVEGLLEIYQHALDNHLCT